MKPLFQKAVLLAFEILFSSKISHIVSKFNNPDSKDLMSEICDRKPILRIVKTRNYGFFLSLRVSNLYIYIYERKHKLLVLIFELFIDIAK